MRRQGCNWRWFWRASGKVRNRPRNFLGAVSYTADTLATVATTPTRHQIQPAPKSSAISSRAAPHRPFVQITMDDGGRSPSPGWVRRLADSTEDIPYYHVESGTVPLSYPLDYLSRTGMGGVTSRAGGRQGEQRGREGRPRGWTRRLSTCASCP